jgi:hypothetical protein
MAQGGHVAVKAEEVLGDLLSEARAEPDAVGGDHESHEAELDEHAQHGAEADKGVHGAGQELDLPAGDHLVVGAPADG